MTVKLALKFKYLSKHKHQYHYIHIAKQTIQNIKLILFKLFPFNFI